MKEISSDGHLNEKRRPLKVAYRRRKSRTKQSRTKKIESAEWCANQTKDLEKKKEERKSQPEV